MIDINSINLNLLRSFITTAETGSMEKAGEILGYSHSTISTNISTLEKQFNVKLFTRKPLKLTDVGEEIYKTIRRGLTDINFATVIANSRNNLENGKISIGCPSHIVDFYLMNKIAKATKDYPNLEISLDTSYECEDLIEAVKENKIDFAILDRIPTQYERDIEIKEIKKSDYMFIADKEINIKNVSELEQYKYILSGEERTNTITLLNIMKKYDVKLDVVLRCRTN